MFEVGPQTEKQKQTSLAWNTTKLWRWISFGAAGLVLLIPVLIAVRYGGLYNSTFVDNALSGWGMWGTFIIHMATRPSRKEIGATLLLGAAMRLLYDLAIGEKGYSGSIVIAMGVFLGLASLIVLVIHACRIKAERRILIRRTLTVIAIFNYMGVCLGFYLALASAMLPLKLDYFLSAFDFSLGTEPAFKLGKLVSAFPVLYWSVIMVYNSFGIWFSVIYAAHARAHGRFRFNIVRLFVANAFIGFSLYFLFPAMGPKYAFPAFPNLPAIVKTGAALLTGPPNAMPSLHFAGALMIFWMAQPWKWLRVATGSFCALTAIATLSTGEHYFVDLIVALPYALAIFALASDVPEKRFPMLVGAAMVLTWFGILRYGSIHPALSWSLVLVTTILCFKLQRRFARNIWAAGRYSRPV